MPTHSALHAHRFAQLFRGRSDAYGVHEPGAEVDARGKRQGRSYTRTGVVTTALYSEHLAGKTGLGIVPICDDDRCFFGAIDVDDYNGERDHIVSAIYRHNLPLNPFRSKSGGLHLFIFFQENAPLQAAKVIPLLQEFRDLLGLSPKTEIFPKQKSVGGGTGNWINIPYFGNTNRCLIGSDGRDMPFEAALDYLEERRVGEDSIRRTLDELAFSDGPPCLQALFIQGVTNNRNNFMFSAARYYKSKYGEDEFADYVKELNSALPDPLPVSEIDSTVIATHRKRDYSYKCTDAPLCDVCNKNKCKGRRFGIGNSEVSELSFGPITQYLADPPYYEWIINGKVFKFHDEDSLTKQNEFHKQSIRILHFKPAQLKQYAWDQIVNNALKQIVVKGVDAQSSFDLGAMFMSYLVEFLTKRAMAANRAQILLNRVFIDPELKAYIFRAMDFAKFLTDVKRCRAFTFPEIQERLQGLGGEAIRYLIDTKNKPLAVWRLPEAAIFDQLTDVSGAADSLDFLAGEAEEEF